MDARGKKPKRTRRRLVRHLRWVVPVLLFVSFFAYMAATGRWTPVPSQAEPVYRYAPTDLSAADTLRVMDDIVHGEFGLPADAPLELWGVLRKTDKSHLFISVTLRVTAEAAEPLIGPHVTVDGATTTARPFRMTRYSTPWSRRQLDQEFYRLPREIKSAKVEQVYLPDGQSFYRLSAPPYNYFSLTKESTLSRPGGLLPYWPRRPALFP